jgi:hypothetical protein
MLDAGGERFDGLRSIVLVRGARAETVRAVDDSERKKNCSKRQCSNGDHSAQCAMVL